MIRVLKTIKSLFIELAKELLVQSKMYLMLKVDLCNVIGC